MSSANRPPALLNELGDRGIHLYLSDDKLRAVAAKEAMTGDVRQLIDANREELITFLREREGTAPPPAAVPLGRLRVATDRLLLRPMQAGDEDDVLAYRSREDVYRYLGREPVTRATIGAFFADRAGGARVDRDGERVLLAVELDGRVIGDYSLTRGRPVDAQSEFGAVFHPDCQGRGYATEVLAAMFTCGFDELRLHRMYGRVDPRNTASIQLCDRLGMRREGHLREESWCQGRWADQLIFAMLDREWRARG